MSGVFFSFFFFSFHISPSFVASGRLCFMIVTYSGYLQIFPLTENIQI